MTQISSDGNCDLETLSSTDLAAFDVGRETLEGLTTLTTDAVARTAAGAAVDAFGGEGVEVTVSSVAATAVSAAAAAAAAVPAVVPVLSSPVPEFDSCLLLMDPRLLSLPLRVWKSGRADCVRETECVVCCFRRRAMCGGNTQLSDQRRLLFVCVK